MRIGDLIEYVENDEVFIGLVINIQGHPMRPRGLKILWCFNQEDKEFFDETSWLCEDEVALISKRT